MTPRDDGHRDGRDDRDSGTLVRLLAAQGPTGTVTSRRDAPAGAVAGRGPAPGRASLCSVEL